ncbi:MAG: hypothetical protein ACKOYN_12195 [Planctomycetota bacterium]
MNQTPTVKMIRDEILKQARLGAFDPIEMQSLRESTFECLRALRSGIDTAFDYWQRGLVSEFAGTIDDFPELIQQSNALVTMCTEDEVVKAVWAEHIVSSGMRVAPPSMDEVERLASLSASADRLRELLDALRISALQRSSARSRVRILRKLREADPRNRSWLDQIEQIEREWLREIAALRTRPAGLEELELGMQALSGHPWIVSVPRGLREELQAKAQPLRLQAAAARYALVATKVREALAAGDRDALTELEARWFAVEGEAGRPPSDDESAAVREAFDWLAARRAEEQVEVGFASSVQALHEAIDAGAPVESIYALVDQIKATRIPPPQDLVERVQQYLQAAHEAPPPPPPPGASSAAHPEQPQGRWSRFFGKRKP